MSQWFSNRGQMIQVACAVVGAAVGLLIYFSVRPEQLLSGLHEIGPKVLSTLVGAAAGVFVGWVVTHLLGRERAPPAIQSKAQAPSAFSSSYAASDPSSQSAPLAPSPPQHQFQVAAFRIRRGDKHVIDPDSFHDVTVILHRIRKYGRSKPLDVLRSRVSEYEAELEFTYGSTLANGPLVQQVDVNRFWVPVAVDLYHAEDCSLFSFSYSDKHLSFFSARIAHINFVAEEVDLVVCNFRAIKQ